MNLLNRTWNPLDSSFELSGFEFESACFEARTLGFEVQSERLGTGIQWIPGLEFQLRELITTPRTWNRLIQGMDRIIRRPVSDSAGPIQEETSEIIPNARVDHCSGQSVLEPAVSDPALGLPTLSGTQERALHNRFLC